MDSDPEMRSPHGSGNRDFFFFSLFLHQQHYLRCCSFRWYRSRTRYIIIYITKISSINSVLISNNNYETIIGMTVITNPATFQYIHSTTAWCVTTHYEHTLISQKKKTLESLLTIFFIYAMLHCTAHQSAGLIAMSRLLIHKYFCMWYNQDFFFYFSIDLLNKKIRVTFLQVNSTKILNSCTQCANYTWRWSSLLWKYKKKNIGCASINKKRSAFCIVKESKRALLHYCICR